MVDCHRELEHVVACLVVRSCFAARRAKAAQQLDLGRPGDACCLWVELAGAGLFQFGPGLHSPAHRFLVSRSPLASDSAKLGSNLSTLPGHRAGCGPTDDLATDADFVPG